MMLTRLETVVPDTLGASHCSSTIPAVLVMHHADYETGSKVLLVRRFLLLQRWRDLVIETDPDIIIGYNICNFDLPYLIKRAETLKVHEFPYWGRNRKMCALLRHPWADLSTQLACACQWCLECQLCWLWLFKYTCRSPPTATCVLAACMEPAACLAVIMQDDCDNGYAMHV